MSGERTVFRGGTVLTMVPGDEPRVADLLVDGTAIAAIDRDLNVDAREIDARGCIVMPGLVDTHRHVWLALLRGLAADWSFKQMLRVVRYQAPRFYRPEDMEVGNELGMTEALEAGVTTVLDFSHCIKGAEHTDALIDGSRASGVRSAFHLGLMDVFGLDPEAEPGLFGGYDERADYLRRLAGGWRGDGRLSLGTALSRWLFHRDDPHRTVREVELSRELGLRITAHIQTLPIEPGSRSDIELLGDADLLGPDLTFAHMIGSTDSDIAKVLDAGAGIACCPTASMIGSGSLPPMGRVHAAGGTFGLGVDLVPRGSGSLLGEIRTGVLGQRMRNRVEAEGVPPGPGEVPAELLVRAATAGGARAMGLQDRIGTLEPGKEADVIMVRGDGIHTFPLLDPYRTLAFHVEVADVDTVMVRGELRKSAGRMLSDVPALMGRAQRSHEYLMERWAEAGGLDPDDGRIDVGF